MNPTLNIDNLECKTFFEKFYNNPIFGIVICSDDGKILNVNNTFCKFIDYELKELIEKNFEDFFLEDEHDFNKTCIENFDNNKVDYFTTEKRFIRKNTEIIWGEVNSTCFRDETGKIQFYLHIIKDIDIEKKKELLNQESEAIFNEIYNNTSDAVFIIDVINGRFFIKSVNPAETELTGLTKEILGDGKYPEEFLPPDIAEAVTKNYQVCYETGKPYQYEETLALPAGTRTWSTTLVPVKNQKGEIVKIIGFSRDLTELKNAYREIEKFYLTIQNANDAFFWIDKNGNIIFANSSASYMLDYTIEELKQMKIFDIDTKIKEIDWKFYWEDLKNNVYSNFESIFRRKDESTLPVEITISYLKFDDNEFLSAFVKNITERKTIEKKLKSSEAKLSKIFNTALEAICVVCNNTRKVIDINYGAEIIFGFTKQEVIGKTTVDIGIWVNPEDRDKILAELLEKGVVKQREVLLYDKNYKIRHTLLSAQRISVDDEDNLVVFVKDITDLKTKELALSEAQEKYKIISDNSYAGIILYRSDGTILTANPFFCKLLGYKLDELQGSNYSKISHPNDLQKEIKLIYRLIEKEIDSYSIETRYFNRNNEIVWVESYVSAYRNAQGEIEYFIRVVVDITERKRLETELRKALEKSQEAEKLKTIFLNNISHEIRTPLSSIVSYSDLLLYDIDKATKSKYINIIQTNTYHLLDLIEMVLDLSLIELQSVELDYKVSKLNNVIENLKNKLEKFITQNRKTNIELIFVNKLGTDDFQLYIDCRILFKILYQISENAVKFTEQGYVKIEYELVEKDILQFTISDTGIGIPLSKQALLFNKFRQIDEATTKKYGGLGIGLAIAKGFTDALKGQLWFESVPGEGTKFFVKIPIKTNIDIKSLEEPIEDISVDISNMDLDLIIKELDKYNIKEICYYDKDTLSELCNMFCGSFFVEWENLTLSSTEKEIKKFAEKINNIAKQYKITLLIKYSNYLIKSIEQNRSDIYPQLFRLYADYAIKMKKEYMDLIAKEN